MRKLSIIFILFLSLVLFACDSQTKDNDNNDKEEELNIMIEGTKTLNATMLWQLKDEENTTNLMLSNNLLMLKEGATTATYQSEAIESDQFLELVLSWNVRNLADSQIVFSVSIGNEDGFGDFHILGSFLENNNRSLMASQNDYSRHSIDTLTNKDSANNNLIKLKVVFTSKDNELLALENISVTTKLVNNELIFSEALLTNKFIDVPAIQQLSVPVIGNIICSPTSVAMVVNYFGKEFTQEEMSRKVYDNGAKIYGNWTLNASYAGSLAGLYGRVEYVFDFQTIIDYINNDIPVVLSIKTQTKEQLEGTIMAYADGHLLVLVGFEQIDGKWYGIVNDPAEYEDSKVQRKYQLDQLINVMSGYTYIISDANIF